MNPVRIVLLCILALTLAAADPPADPKLPPDVQKVVDDHDKAVKIAQAAFDAAVAKANAAGVKALDNVIKAHTSKNDLDGAVAAKQVQDGWKKPVEGKGDDDPPASLTPLYIGSWDIEGLTTLKVLAGGKALWGSTPGTWTTDGKVLNFSWGNQIDIPTAQHCKVTDHGRGDQVYMVTISP
jgi:hypothetical protein